MEPSRQPEQDRLDAISSAYDQLILSYLRRFDPITAKGDWHLRLAWIPDGQPEVIYDLDHLCLVNTPSAEPRPLASY